jgi:hypothetical protein
MLMGSKVSKGGTNNVIRNFPAPCISNIDFVVSTTIYA